MLNVYQSSVAKQVALDVQLEYLRMRQPQDWSVPQARKLKGLSKKAKAAYYEIRFIVGKVQQRPIGYFGPTPGVFTILFWATEKGDEFVPPDAVTQANERCGKLQDGTAKSIPLMSKDPQRTL